MHIVEYNKAYEQSILLYRVPKNASLSPFSATPLGRFSFGRVAVIQDGHNDPVASISDYVDNYMTKAPIPGDKLYISSSSKIPRDLVRNSGYKIVRDQKDADHIIVPMPEQEHPLRYFVYALNNDDLYCLNVYAYRQPTGDTIEPEEFEWVKQAFESKYGPSQFYFSGKKLLCNMIRNVPEHLELLRNGSRVDNYYFDTNIQLVPSTNITPENLKIIANMDSKERALKLLLNTDFEKYPFTICAFLTSDLNVRYGYKYGDQVNWMMKKIGYRDYEDGKYEDLPPVTPEDFKMFQDYLFFKLNVSGDNGIVRQKVFEDLDDEYKDMLQYRTAVRKFSITEPMSLATLQTIILNSR